MSMSIGGSVDNLEPLEAEANGAEEGSSPDPALLAEFGLEAATTAKPNETVEDAVNDSIDEVVDPAEATAEDEAVEETEETEKPEAGPKGRAQKRIQSLVKEKKALEERLSARDREFQLQVQRVSQQQAAQAKAMEQQNEILRKQLELVIRNGAQAPAKPLSAVEEYEQRLISDAEERAAQRLNPEIELLKQKIAAQEAREQAAQQRASQNAKIRAMTAQAQGAAKEVLLNDVDVGSFTPDDNSVAEDLVLAYTAATGVPPAKAAQHFKSWLDKYHQARLRKVSKTSGKAIQNSQRVPAPMTQSKTAVQAESKPSWDTLLSHGYDNYVQWMNAGSPRLAPKK